MALLALMAPVTQAAQREQAGPERYLIRYTSGSEPAVNAALARQRGTVQRRLANHRLLSVTLPAPAVDALRRRTDIELIEPDPKRFTQAQTTPYGIGMVRAGLAGLAEAEIHTRRICIMDTGYDISHEDLPGVPTVSGDNGYAGGCEGADCDTGDWRVDGYGHGTHVSGTIAALDNGIGVVGVHGSGGLPIHMVKVFDNDGNWAYGSDLVAAIDQCRAAGAQIINMSLGGPELSTAEQLAFDDAWNDGMLLIASAGNGASANLSYPASYDSVMSVGAVDSVSQVAIFSQYNSQLEIAAPGVAVQSTLPGNSYAAWDGTSMAAPHVSGVAALVWSHHEGCSNADVRNALVAGATDLGGPGRDGSYGHGLVDAMASADLLGDADGCTVSRPPEFVASAIENGSLETIASGSYGDEFRYSLTVPVGASDLRIIMWGEGGDADLHVRFGDTPAVDIWDCRPFINGNSETCVIDNPNPGTWQLMVRGYTEFTGVNLTASYVTDNAALIPLYFHPVSETPVQGTVTGSFADLMFNDGVMQTVTEVASGGKPSRRTSLAEHRWRFAGVASGASVTFRLVAAGQDRGEGDNFIFEIYDAAAGAWSPLVTLPLGGALKTYSVALPATTSGEVLIRAYDADRTGRNQALEKLYVDQMEIVTVVDGSGTPPVAPDLTGLSLVGSAVRVEWADNSDNEIGFEIRRAPRVDGVCQTMGAVGQVGAGVTSWLDETVAFETEYCYQVAAKSAFGDSESGTLWMPTGAAPDLLLTATGDKDKGKIVVSLEWFPASDVSVLRSVNGGQFEEVADGLTGTTYEDRTGLKGGPTLDYRICPTTGACSNTVTLIF